MPLEVRSWSLRFKITKIPNLERTVIRSGHNQIFYETIPRNHIHIRVACVAACQHGSLLTSSVPNPYRLVHGATRKHRVLGRRPLQILHTVLMTLEMNFVDTPRGTSCGLPMMDVMTTVTRKQLTRFSGGPCHGISLARMSLERKHGNRTPRSP